MPKLPLLFGLSVFLALPITLPADEAAPLSASMAVGDAARTPQPVANPLGVLALFSQTAALAPGLVNQLLGAGFEAQMQIPPEHLGVKFWDLRTGQEIDRQEIRNLVGVGNHAALLQLWQAAEQLSPGQLPLTVAQLMDITDAAYIGSLMQPPVHIDIEYYDTRHGPTGKGGGASGSTPAAPLPPVPAEPRP